MADTPGPRMATRATSRIFNQAPTPVPQGRRPRASNKKAATPLPATGNAENNAYGSAGKVDLGSQNANNMSNDDFMRAFTSARNDATNQRKSKAKQSVNEVDEEDELEDEEEDQDSENDDDVTPEDDESSSPKRSTRSNTKSTSSVRFSTDPPQQNGRSTSTQSPDKRSARQRTASEDREDDDQPSALPRHLHRLRNNYDTSPLVASSILQQRKSRAFSVTEINSGFSYEAPQQFQASASRPRLLPRSREASLAAAVVPPATLEEIRAANPRSPRVLLESVARYYRRIPLWGILLPIIIPLIWVLMSMMGYPPTALAIDGAGCVASGLNAVSHAIKDSLSNLLSIEGSSPAGRTRFDTNLARMGSQFDLLRQDVRQIQSVLPSVIVVRKDPVTGEVEIPNDFWLALRNKVAGDASLKSNSAESWDNFLAQNKARIAKVVESSAQAAAQDAIVSRVASGEILNKSAFMDVLEQRMLKHDTKFSERLSSFEANIQRQLNQRSRASSSSNANAAPLDLQHWAVANMIRNQELTLRKVNYFSPALGAIVNPDMSSPTKDPPPSKLRRTWNKFWGIVTYVGHPHLMAIDRWEEATDCWCASPSDEKGKAQLAVILPREILPTSLTIEHIPLSGTLDIGSAPKNFEIWVYAPHVQPPATLADQRARVPDCGVLAGGGGAMEPPAEGYICIGGGRYEIHAPPFSEDDPALEAAHNHVQNFEIFAPGDIGFVDRVVVRVADNWSQDWTCIYRIRMHGTSREEIEAAAGKN